MYTLWGEYANQLIGFMSENSDVPVILILQLAKFKLYKGIFLKKFLPVLNLSLFFSLYEINRSYSNY